MVTRRDAQRPEPTPLPAPASFPPAVRSMLAPRIAHMRDAFARATTGDLEGLELEDRMALQAIALETALLLFEDAHGDDGALRAALTHKWPHFQPYFDERIADGVNEGRDRLELQLDCLVVLLHTFVGNDDDELRRPVFEKLGAMGRPQDVPAILRHVLHGTQLDVVHGVSALRALLARQSDPERPEPPRRKPRRRRVGREADARDLVAALGEHLCSDDAERLRSRLTDR
jgi:hypothetical protein